MRDAGRCIPADPDPAQKPTLQPYGPDLPGRVEYDPRAPLMVTLTALRWYSRRRGESYDRLWTKHLLDNFDLPVFTDLPLLGAASPDQSARCCGSGLSGWSRC
ncbi:MAG: hypothetical protein IPK52_19885 [Chloroflexi bacterium]|nr:hypothetical protein [Chloroflexota bacterium]